MTTPRTRHLRLIAAEMTDEHAAETVRGAADKIEQLREQLVKLQALPLEWRKEAVKHSNAAADDDCDVGGEEWRLHREASRVYKKCALDVDAALTDDLREDEK